MPETQTRVGTGATIAFGTSSFSAEVLSLNGNAISRPAIDTTHLGTTDYRTFIPGELVDPGSLDVEIHFAVDAQPPIAAAAETVTITFPSALTNGGTLAGSGFLTDWSWGNPLEDKITASFTLKWTGTPTWTDASAA